jgi:hypothetical protein
VSKFNVGDIVRWFEQEEIKGTETQYEFAYGVIVRVVVDSSNKYETYRVKWFRDNVGTNVDYDPRFLVRAQ